MKTLRIGFLGSGWINSVHAKSVAKLPAIELVAVYNHNLAGANAFNEKHLNGRAACFDNLDAMLQTQQLDAMYIAIPPGAHVGQTELVARHGVHLMLEKPIALTNERAASIATAVRSSGVLCQIGHHMRHTLPVRKLKQMLQEGVAGRPLFMQGRFFVNSLFPAWWRDPAMGGGQLIEQAIHIYDLARYFMGEPEIVSAFAGNLHHGRFSDYKVDDISASVIRFKNGSIASLCASNCAEPGNSSITFTLQFEKLIADFANPDTATFIHTGGKIGDEIARGEGQLKREVIQSETNSYDELSANFISAIRDGTPLRSGIDDGVESLRLVQAAAASAAANGTVQAF